MSITSPKIGIADAIESLRTDLSEAIARGDGQALRFKVEGIELELAVVCEVGGNSKASFHVLGIGAEVGGKVGATTTHRVKLSLKPADQDGKAKDTYVHGTIPRRPDDF